jgi:hypothetical protein
MAGTLKVSGRAPNFDVNRKMALIRSMLVV